MFWLFFTILAIGCSQQTLPALQELDLKIAELQARVMLLAERRAVKYGYDKIAWTGESNRQNTMPTIDRLRREYFWEGMTEVAQVRAGAKSFLLNIRQELYLAECHEGHMEVYNESGYPIATVNATISHYSYVKSPSQPLIGFLSTKNSVFLCSSDTNFTDCSQTDLESSLPHKQVVSLYVSKVDNKYIISLASQNGKIHVFDQQGVQRSIINTSFKKILKIVDHAPYPVIVSPTGFSMLEPNRMVQVDLGCPLFDTDIIDATAESAYSSTLYILFANEIMGYSFSSKKQDKECKMATHLKLIHSSGDQITWMNPSLVMNNTFINTSDLLTNKQLLIPLELCENNTYQSVYRKQEFYLLHKCCSTGNCENHLYRKGKLTSSTNKFYKFGIFIVLLLVVTFKMFNRSPKDSGARKQDQDDLANRQQARIKQIIEMFEKDKPSKSQIAAKTKKSK